MRRREFVGLIGSMAATWPFSTRAQRTAMPVIGFLHYGSPEAYVHVASAVRQGLRESGFIEGQNVAVEFRWADGQYERLPALASELVERHVLAIAAAGVVVTAITSGLRLKHSSINAGNRSPLLSAER